MFKVSAFTHEGILIMAVLAFILEQFPGQRLHLHTILVPNWARNEAPIKHYTTI